MCSITFDWEKNDAMEKVRHFEKGWVGSCGKLLWVTAELTELCNHKCIYCYENAGPKKDYRIVSRDDMRKLIGYVSDQGVRQFTCSGGEPLLYPHIEETVKLARDSGMVVHMITNGYALTPRMAQRLAAAGLSQVQINIDSVRPEKHDMMRGKKGSFGHAIAALKNAREAGMTCVTQTVLTLLNEDEIIDIFSLARSLGVQRCRVWDMVPSEGRSLDNVSLRPSRNYMETIRNLTGWAAENGAINIESGDPLFHSRVEDRLPITGGYCPYSIGLLANLSVSGDSYFCCTFRGKPMYNIYDVMKSGDSLRDAHMQALSRFLNSTQLLKLPDTCMACDFVNTCKGGCHMRRGANDYRDYWCRKLNQPEST